MSLYVLVYLIVFVPWEKQSSWKDTDKQKAQQRGKMREREREKEPLSISCNLTMIFVMKKT